MTSSTGLQMRSTLKRDGVLEIALVPAPVPKPADDEVLIRVEAAPLNPSDLALLFAGGDVSKATQSGTATAPVIRIPMGEGAMKALAGRLEKALPVGNEGAGVVVEAGASEAARALLGRTVATFGGAMYAQYRTIQEDQCLVLPPGTASALVGAGMLSVLLFPLIGLALHGKAPDGGVKPADRGAPEVAEEG